MPTNYKTSELDSLSSVAAGDLLRVVDISDTTMGAGGTDKKLTAANLATYIHGQLGATGTSVISIAITATSEPRVTITASATPHTKGAYSDLIAATGFAAESLVLDLGSETFTSATNTAVLMDIALGTAGNEVVLVSNINLGFRPRGSPIVLPIAVPSGSRISGRIQGAQVSKTINPSLSVRAAGDHSTVPTACDTYGADTATSNGTILTAPGATHTKGAWTQITASTTANITRLVVGLNVVSTTAGNDVITLVDIGTGSAGNEVVLIPNIGQNQSSTEYNTALGTALPYTVSIPSGTRIAARYQASSTSANSRPTVILHGFR